MERANTTSRQKDASANPSATRDVAIQPRQMHALIMKGGGVKGLAFAGAVDELERFYSFDVFVGTSAGAIGAALLAAGATGAELEARLRLKSFREFLDGSIWNLPSLLIHKGVHPGYSFVNWLREELHRYVPKRSDVRMSDLPKRAVIYAASSGRGEITFDSIGQHRDIAVHAAVRCSISIPYFFQPQSLDNRRVFDGGLLHNYPVSIFLDQERSRDPNGGKSDFIALYLGPEKPSPISRGFLFSDLLNTIVERNDPEMVDRYRAQTIVIDTEPVGTIDFDLTESEKDFLVLLGRVSALRFLASRGLLDGKEAQAIERLSDDVMRVRADVVRKRKEKRSRIRSRVGIAATICAMLIVVWLAVGNLTGLFGVQCKNSIESIECISRSTGKAQCRSRFESIECLFRSGEKGR